MRVSKKKRAFVWIRIVNGHDVAVDERLCRRYWLGRSPVLAARLRAARDELW